MGEKEIENSKMEEEEGGLRRERMKEGERRAERKEIVGERGRKLQREVEGRNGVRGREGGIENVKGRAKVTIFEVILP